MSINKYCENISALHSMDFFSTSSSSMISHHKENTNINNDREYVKKRRILTVNIKINIIILSLFTLLYK
jgi:hypothetical protein